jgi:hypothetical protein
MMSKWASTGLMLGGTLANHPMHSTVPLRGPASDGER